MALFCVTDIAIIHSSICVYSTLAQPPIPPGMVRSLPCDLMGTVTADLCSPMSSHVLARRLRYNGDAPPILYSLGLMRPGLNGDNEELPSAQISGGPS